MADDPQLPDEGGVFGKLPHSRPGRRSEKREAGRPGSAARAAARKAEAAGSPAARKPAGARRKPSGGARTKPRPPQPVEAAEGHGGPVGDAVHAATRVARAGVRVASALASEFVRRLPRP
jgi:hypothetical protein